MKFLKILELIEEDTEVELLSESSYPLIGVFWLYNNEIIGDTRDPKDPNDTVPQKVDSETVIGGRKSHFSIWKDIVPKELDTKTNNYQTLPRGRVMKLLEQNKFIVLANKTFNTLELRSKIKRYYNLSENNIIWDFDRDHYNIKSI